MVGIRRGGMLKLDIAEFAATSKSWVLSVESQEERIDYLVRQRTSFLLNNKNA